jgi:hypothetical protein
MLGSDAPHVPHFGINLPSSPQSGTSRMLKSSLLSLSAVNAVSTPEFLRASISNCSRQIPSVFLQWFHQESVPFPASARIPPPIPSLPEN